MGDNELDRALVERVQRGEPPQWVVPELADLIR